MGAIIFEISMLVLVIAFLVFLAIDDRRNQKLRAREDEEKAALARQRQDTEKSPHDGN